MNKELNINFEKYIITKDGIFSKYFKKQLKGNETVDGYLKVTLKNNDGTNGCYYIHRVIWSYFNGEIPENMQVNHKDENKYNNSLSNLDLISPKDNCNWGKRTEKNIKNRNHIYRRTVYQYSDKGKLVNSYKSVREAERATGFNEPNIAKACRGKFKLYKGYRWSYEPL